ncbi:MAG: oligosaccharide flippase family protein [Bacteroidales bacterium]|nr:oligosaccharide flippase family protein [Bacteroidales bacterium]
MGRLSSLASDTVIYGATTILSRLLNWLLMPYYLTLVTKSVYGQFSGIYAIIAILLVLACLGLETGYFRFVNKENRKTIFDTLNLCMVSFGLLLVLVLNIFREPFAALFSFPEDSSMIMLISSLIVVTDAVNSLYFADLRFIRQGKKYALIRLLQVIVNIIFTIFFMEILRYQVLFGIDFTAFGDIEYLLLSNLIGSLTPFLFYVPGYLKEKHSVDFALLKQVMTYSLPLLAMGFFGITNQEIEKLLILHLDISPDPHGQLGIYSANYKIGVLMAVFTQSFRLAFEPFFFKETQRDKSDTSVYAESMKYFYMFGLLIFVGVILFIPLFNYIIQPEYYEGNKIIPIVLLSQLLFGVYYNLSIWYKVTDKTYYGFIFSVVGLTVNVIMNCLLIPSYSYYGAAISAFTAFFVMVLVSLLLGKKHYPINYPILKLINLTLIAIFIVVAYTYFTDNFYLVPWYVWSVVGVLTYLLVVVLFEKKNVSKVLAYVHNKDKNRKQE